MIVDAEQPGFSQQCVSALRLRCARRPDRHPYLARDQALRDTEIIRMGSLPGMDLQVTVEPQQGASYGDVLRVAKAADELGFEASSGQITT